MFIKKNRHANVSLKFVCDGKLITFYFLKNLKRKQDFYTDIFWNYQLLNMAVWSGYISSRVRGRGGEREGRH